jgi:hypothetical protein
MQDILDLSRADNALLADIGCELIENAVSLQNRLGTSVQPDDQAFVQGGYLMRQSISMSFHGQLFSHCPSWGGSLAQAAMLWQRPFIKKSRSTAAFQSSE